MATTGLKIEAVAFAPDKKGNAVVAVLEHPYIVRLTHWVNAISVTVLTLSGLRIFAAFPSFGPKADQQNLVGDQLLIYMKKASVGGWLGGALQWHFTFMWFFMAAGVLYVGYQLFTGHRRQVIFNPAKDLKGVWPMARHYFLFGPKPEVTEAYNPLQKLAYTQTIACGALAMLTGLVLWKPVQFSLLTFLFGGFHLTRIWHFAAMLGFVAFIPGHLIMVAVHGWNNFYSMLVGWKKDPEYRK